MMFAAGSVVVLGVYLLGVAVRLESCGSHGGGIRLLSWREYIRGVKRGDYAPPWRRFF